MLKYLALAIAAITLTACSGSPSESEISAALKKSINEHNQAMNRLGGNNTVAQGMLAAMKVEIKSVKKIGCKADGENAYLCDVEVEATSGGTTSKNAAPVRMLKASDGWIASK